MAALGGGTLGGGTLGGVALSVAGALATSGFGGGTASPTYCEPAVGAGALPPRVAVLPEAGISIASGGAGALSTAIQCSLSSVLP